MEVTAPSGDRYETTNSTYGMLWQTAPPFPASFTHSAPYRTLTNRAGVTNSQLPKVRLHFLYPTILSLFPTKPSALNRLRYNIISTSTFRLISLTNDHGVGQYRIGPLVSQVCRTSYIGDQAMLSVFYFLFSFIFFIIVIIISGRNKYEDCKFSPWIKPSIRCRQGIYHSLPLQWKFFTL